MATEIDPKVFARILQGGRMHDPSPLTVDVNNYAGDDIFRARLQQMQGRHEDSLNPYRNTVYGGGPGAIIAGLLSGYSKYKTEQNNNAEIDEFLDYETQRRARAVAAERQQAAEAAEVKRAQELEDERRRIENEKAMHLWKQQNTPQDPMKALNAEKARLEIENLRNPRQQLPAKAEEYEYARRNGFPGTYEDFLNIGKAPAKAPEPSFEEKEQIKVDTKREGELAASASQRHQNIEKARYFLDKFKGGANSGRGRQALSWAPTFTDQGRFDEEFNAFAETAARSMLKAAGETRPTDADVKGMKESIFGIGRDEQVNIRLLEQYIAAEEAQENEYRSLSGGEALPSATARSDSSIDDLVTKYAY